MLCKRVLTQMSKKFAAEKITYTMKETYSCTSLTEYTSSQ